MKFIELLDNYNNQDQSAASINERIIAKSDDDSECCCIKCFDCLQGFANCMG